MSRKISIVLVLAGCAVVLSLLLFRNSGIKAETDDASTLLKTQLPPKPVDRKIVAADNAFGFEMFSRLAQSDQDKNILMSPLSIATALSMAFNGASGQTKTQMASALKASTLPLGEVNSGNAGLRASLISADPNVELTIANSLWAQRGVDFQNSFLEANRKYFNAEIASLDFNDPQASNTINVWVKKNTKGKIPRIVNHIDAQTVMFLINAIYFKGKWQKPFDKAQTRDSDFNSDGGKKSVPMMTQSGEYSYFKADDFAAVSLPYGNGRLEFTIFLPNEKTDLKTFLRKLNATNWDTWTDRFQQREGSVTIPRFKMDYEETLNDALKVLGMTDAFNPQRADFRAMRPARDVCISSVQHNAVMEVNEEGTEAAAVTSVGTATASDKPSNAPFVFVANRPFFCAIRDTFSSSLLFLGALRDPQ